MTSNNFQSIGISKGYKVVECTPVTAGGNTTITTPAVTLSVTVTRPTDDYHYIPSWNYNATIITPKMTRNGVDVTLPDSPEVPVMVGERNAMDVSIVLPQDAGIPTYQWTIEGDKIKDFTETVGNPTANPPIPYKGEKVDFPNGDLQIKSPHFYWYNGSFTGAAKKVEVVVTIDGHPITLKSQFKVYRPRFNSFTAEYTNNNPAFRYSDLKIIMGDSNSPGISYNANVETPNIPTALGTTAFEQILTYNYGRQGTKDAVSYDEVKKVIVDALDSDDDDPRYSDSAKAIAAGGTVDVDSNDSPFLGSGSIGGDVVFQQSAARLKWEGK